MNDTKNMDYKHAQGGSWMWITLGVALLLIVGIPVSSIYFPSDEVRAERDIENLQDVRFRSIGNDISPGSAPVCADFGYEGDTCPQRTSWFQGQRQAERDLEIAQGELRRQVIDNAGLDRTLASVGFYDCPIGSSSAAVLDNGLCALTKSNPLCERSDYVLEEFSPGTDWCLLQLDTSSIRSSPPLSAGDRDCSDFSGTVRINGDFDPHGLDRDNDGIGCEANG